MTTPLTSKQVEDHKLPNYLSRAVDSGHTASGNYALLSSEQWRELAVAAHRHITHEEACTKSCKISAGLPCAGRIGIRATLDELLSIVNSAPNYLAASSKTKDIATIVYRANERRIKLLMVPN